MVGNLSATIKPLKKVHVVYRRDPQSIIDVLVAEGFSVVNENPDFVLCYGGDGTVLYSERSFPGAPKLIIKTSIHCRRYDYDIKDLTKLLRKIRSGNYQICPEMKLEAQTKNMTLVGLNEVQVHLKMPIYAVRFSFSSNGTKYSDLIGDGVIVSTPFGSTGYYAATGGKPFSEGIGVSFNNLHINKVPSFVVRDDSVVQLAISRGPAWLVADNNEKFIELNAGDIVEIKKSAGAANFIYVADV
jgi:NAD+ kinase